jgi:hypothetical protein
MGKKESLADFPVRQAVCGQLGDLRLLRAEIFAPIRSVLTDGLSRGAKLLSGSVGPGNGSHGVEPY